MSWLDWFWRKFKMTSPSAFKAVSKVLSENLFESQTLPTKEANPVTEPAAKDGDILDFIGESPAILKIKKEINNLQQINSTSILISGESGTGKELIARAIHFGGVRAKAPFIAVNCATLDEPSLFGQVQSIDTVSDCQSYFELAAGGTLLLDNINEMPLSLQTKLLQALAEGTFKSVGSEQKKLIDVQLIATTNIDLATKTFFREFSSDLYFRLVEHTVHLTPLRERREDIPLLVEHLLSQLAREMNRPKMTLTSLALQLLKNYSFPGNIRELKNILEQTLICNSGNNILQAEQKILDYVDQHESIINSKYQHFKPQIDKKSLNLDDKYLHLIVRKDWFLLRLEFYRQELDRIKANTNLTLEQQDSKSKIEEFLHFIELCRKVLNRIAEIWGISVLIGKKQAIKVIPAIRIVNDIWHLQQINQANSLTLSKNANLIFRQAGNLDTFAFLIGKSAAIIKIINDINLLQKIRRSNILIIGENGTYKELVAAAIHFGGVRAKGPFIAVNCATIPSELCKSVELAQSILFGDVLGTFLSGDWNDHKGYFELATGGTLFLDEIDKIHPLLEFELLKALKKHTFTPVGSCQERQFNVQVIAATRLPNCFSKFCFPLIDYTVHLPPLRERREDIPLLIEHFLSQLAIEMELPKTALKTPSLQLLAYLKLHPLPGNVKELRNILKKEYDYLRPSSKEENSKPKSIKRYFIGIKYIDKIPYYDDCLSDEAFSSTSLDLVISKKEKNYNPDVNQTSEQNAGKDVDKILYDIDYLYLDYSDSEDHLFSDEAFFSTSLDLESSRKEEDYNPDVNQISEQNADKNVDKILYDVEYCTDYNLDTNANQISDQEAKNWGISAFIGKSQIIIKIINNIRRLQPIKKTNILILGESGTGKELVARAIHFGGVRADGPFIAVNCAAIPSELTESILFGHVRGAFTGAVNDRKGYFELASGGTLFLDEMGEMPYPLQAKLLRTLENGTFMPVGSYQEKRVDVRVIAATNVNLATKMLAGEFRNDLYFRLAGYTIQLPSLRERREDISLLVDYFLSQLATEMDRPKKTLDSSARELLEIYSFPGNVRELRNILEQAIIISDDNEVIQSQHIRLLDSITTNETTNSSSPVTTNKDKPISLSFPKAQQEILTYIRQQGSVTNSECQRHLNVDYHRASYLLKEMKRRGQLVLQGSRRGSYYVLADSQKSEKMVNFQDNQRDSSQ